MNTKYFQSAEIMNGRLAMIGLFAAIVNYGLTGWIMPGIFQVDLFVFKDSISIIDSLNDF